MDINIYLLINRILTTDELDLLMIDLKKLKNIKGIYYEDLGVFYLLKDSKLKLINFQTHFNTNKEAIDYQLKIGNDSLVIASDLTYAEIEDIVKSKPNKLTVFLFGKVEVMYSRRLLKSNYQNFYKLDKTSNLIAESRTNITFELAETEYGTYIFDNNYYNGLKLLKCNDLVKNFIISAKDITNEKLIELISIIKSGEYEKIEELFININSQFLEKETIYRVKGGE